MSEIAADANSLLIGFVSGSCGAGIAIPVRQMLVDEIDDRAHALRSGRDPAEQIPSFGCQAIGIAIAAAEEIGEDLCRELLDGLLIGVMLRIGLSAIFYDEVARK